MITSLRLFIVAIILILNHELIAQADAHLNNLKNIVPPPPDAGNLGKYADWPVNLYTGLPSIEVPLHTLKGKDLSVPLSLSYHASGNKVGDIASWVGLNWTLQGGGVITRSIRGLPDEEGTSGYFVVRQNYTNPDDLGSQPLSTSLHTAYIKGSAKGEVDTEQDIYYFNALGRSFKLLFSGGKFITVPYSNIKIAANVDQGTWNVILEDGTILTFGGVGFIEVNSSTKFASTVGSLNYASSWYLKSIKSPKGEIINFEYTVSLVRQDQFATESDYIMYAFNACLPVDESSPRKTVQRAAVYNFNLKKIESDFERIEFDTTSRADLEGGKKLSRLRIYSKLTNEYIDEYSFFYHYSQAVTGNSYGSDSYQMKRLRLEKIQRGLAGSTNFQNWMFDYNPINLPSRCSYAQDHWGYYNGRTQNSTLLPYIFFAIPAMSIYPNGIKNMTGFMSPLHPEAIRYPDANYMQAEMLTKMTYPTGGFTTFEYEPNSIAANDVQFKDTVVNVSLNLYYGQSYFTNLITVPIDIPSPEYSTITLSGGISSAILNDFPAANISVQLIDPSGAGVESLGGKQNVSVTKNIVLRSAGIYTFKVSTNVQQSDLYNSQTYVTINASIRYKKQKTNPLKLVGGLRIRKMTDYPDAISSGQQRNFSYENPFIIHDLKPQEDYLTIRKQWMDALGGYCEQTLVTRNSSTKFSIGSIQGSNVGYGKVTTLYGQNGENGRTVSFFSNETDSDVEQSTSFPFPPASSRDIRRGLLIKQMEFAANSITPLRVITNEYQFVSKGYATCFKAGFSSTDPANPNSVLNTIETKYYFNYNEHVKKLTISECEYSGLDSLKKVTNFIFENAVNSEPTATEFMNSEGKLVKSYKRTPLEKSLIQASISISPSASAAIDSMINRNILRTELYTEDYSQSLLKQRVLSNYKIVNNIIVPDNINIQQGNGPLETRVSFANYDSKGNLLEQNKSKDISMSYQWGYSGNWIIAQTTNAKVNDIFHTSFEDAGEGNSVVNDCKTGVRSKTGGYIKNLNGLSNGIYNLSYWKKISNSWVFQKSTVSVTSNVYMINIPSVEQIDELRFHPEGSLMTTYSYGPYGVVSVSDYNNQTTYYEYDSPGRLKAIRDENRRILKSYKYSFKQ